MGRWRIALLSLCCAQRTRTEVTLVVLWKSTHRHLEYAQPTSPSVSTPSKWQARRKNEARILGKVILDTWRFILGYIAKYPWILFRGSFLLTLWLADKVLDALEGEDELKLTAIETAKDKLMDVNR